MLLYRKYTWAIQLYFYHVKIQIMTSFQRIISLKIRIVHFLYLMDFSTSYAYY